MSKTFTKIRKWAEEVGAKVEDSKHFNKILVTLPNGKKFEFENRESTSRQVTSRGRGLKWTGNPKGLFMCDIPIKGYGGYPYQESSQTSCIEKMSKYL